jgi:putative FmdB family regulatory protein
MPLYEYRCQTCGREEERLESLTAPAAHDCPKCGFPGGMNRILSVAAVGTAKQGPPQSAPASGPAGGCCPGGHGGCPYA